MRFLLFLVLPFHLTAQNLVVNGGFERQTAPVAGVRQAAITPCTYSSAPDQINTSVQGWKTFDVMTPDVLEWDTIAGCPYFPQPRRGKRMVGLIMYHPFQDGQFSFDYHELIQGTLAKPLEKGKTYRLSVWVWTNDSLGVRHLNQIFGRSSYIRPVRCGNFGWYFSKDPINARENFMVSQLDFAVRPQVNLEQIVETNGEWLKITATFQADQPYKYFLFGNFFSDAVTPINMGLEERQALDISNTADKMTFWKKTKRIGYYCFDDFAVVEDSNEPLEKALLEQKKYTFSSALLFDVGKTDLKPAAQTELQQLADVLHKNPMMKVEIGGHTDNVGDDILNQTLSEQRAHTVFDILVQKGVPSGQISWHGYGESTPVASNDTETGRQQNRRVECVVLR